jgi:ribosomal protein S27E
MASPKVHGTFRKYHRWLGFFLSGIIAVYAISGSLLIFRKTDFLKYEYVTEQQLPVSLNQQTLDMELKIEGFSVLSDTQSTITFDQGSYNKQTGVVTQYLPKYVEREFDEFLRCGRLEHGFLRVVCGDCKHEKLVAFSCKRRGFCPSCGARRMAESAALLVDDVLRQ